MQLLYTLPEKETAIITSFLNGEKILYCVPFDLLSNGCVCTDGWLVVTAHLLYRLSGGRITDTVQLVSGIELLCVPQIDCGQLILRSKDTERLLCRFSMRHMVRYSYVARGVTLLCKGEIRTVVSREKEKTCPACGRALPGTNLCPRCSGRGRGLRRLWDLCAGYMLPLLWITLIMVAVSAIVIGQQFIQREFIDQILVPAKGSMLNVFGFIGILLVSTVLLIALSVIRNLWSASLGTRVSRDLRARVFSKINLLSLSFLDSRQTGELMNRVVDDTAKIRQFMEDVFAMMCNQLLIMAGAIGSMLLIDWKLALLTVAFLPAAAVLVRVFHKKEKRLFKQQWRFNDKVNARLQDVISGIRVVKSFGQEQRETERFRGYTQRLMNIQRRNELFWATLYPFVTFLLTIGTFCVVYFGGAAVLNGQMTPGQLTQFIAYAGMLYGPLGFLTRLPRMVMQLTNSLERIYDILDEEELSADGDKQSKKIEGNIVFKDVTFGYHSYVPVLEHIHLQVHTGEMIGLVGASGTGKSTFINLLMRLYDVDEGRILVDGMDIRNLSAESLHSQIGVVLQETFLFTGSIYDNIRYAKPDATDAQIIEAAKMANAHDFITRFADGYDTYVGEHGYTLSGGERQRIAIARAILHNPRLLILDEATSSLDTETEYQIQEALRRLTHNRTTFAIAHRLSTLREATRIVVLDKHHIAEVGTHRELMLQKGIYFGLVMAQLDMHKMKGGATDDIPASAGVHDT